MLKGYVSDLWNGMINEFQSKRPIINYIYSNQEYQIQE